MNPALLNILLHALGSAPEIISDLGAAFSQNWHIPHVAQARQGVSLLSKLLADLDPQKPPAQPVGDVAQPVKVAAPSV